EIAFDSPGPHWPTLRVLRLHGLGHRDARGGDGARGPGVDESLPLAQGELVEVLPRPEDPREQLRRASVLVLIARALPRRLRRQVDREHARGGRDGVARMLEPDGAALRLVARP